LIKFQQNWFKQEVKHCSEILYFSILLHDILNSLCVFILSTMQQLLFLTSTYPSPLLRTIAYKYGNKHTTCTLVKQHRALWERAGGKEQVSEM
jgi:hypothetical protein